MGLPNPLALGRRLLGRGPATGPDGDSGAPDRSARHRDPRLAAPALRVEPHPGADNPVLTAADVDDVDDVHFVADPFVVHDGDRYHLFFEVKSDGPRRLFGLRGTGAQFDIAHATSHDGLDWTYEGVVLPDGQAGHTYPLVFRHDGDWLMTPSPAGSTPREFRVYRAEPFPGEWTLADRALTGEVRIDPTPFRFGEHWYLLYQEAGSFDVVLRHADSLVDGEWREHPESPLFTPGGNDVAQGGRPFVREGYVDVFFRRGSPGVVEAWRLLDLSPGSLTARELPSSPVVSGTGVAGAWNGRNMHHLDAGPAANSGTDLVLVDGQDDARDYRIGVYRTAVEPLVAVEATVEDLRVPPGAEMSPSLDVVRSVGYDAGTPLRVPEAGHYRLGFEVDVEAEAVGDSGDGPVRLTVGIRVDGEALTGGRVMVEDRPTGGRLRHGPVYLDGGARLRSFLRHDADRTVDVGSVSVAMRRCW
jgi:hypothetical protein